MIVKNVEKLGEIIKQYHKDGKTVILKSGVFDIVHYAHVASFASLKKLADVVIIDLWSDYDTSIYKPGRPILAQKERALLLDGMQDVDIVFMRPSYMDKKGNNKFPEKYPTFLKKVNVDLIALKKDIKKEHKQFYVKNKYKYVQLPEHTKKISTTKIIERIKNKA